MMIPGPFANFQPVSLTPTNAQTLTSNRFNLTGDDVWDSLHRSNIAPAPHAVNPLGAQPAAIITWYQGAAGLLNQLLASAASAPTNPNPAPGTPTPPYQYTPPTVIPYREPAKPTNPKVNETRVLELYNQGKGEMDLLKMFANMSYEDLKRIIGKK